MHEYSLIASLVGQVEAIARERGAASVKRLRVRLGELAGVDRALFETAYRTFRERTICEGAELEIAEIPARYECPQCRREFARGDVLRCEACRRPAVLTRGDDLILERVELEIPD